MFIHLCRVPDILIVAHLPQRVKDKRNNLRPAIHNFHARPARQPGEYQVVGRIAQAQDALSLHPAVQAEGRRQMPSQLGLQMQFLLVM